MFTLFVVTTLIAGLVATLSATAARVISEMQWHELEELCQQQQKPDLFSQIIDRRDQLDFGVGILKMVSFAVAACGAFAWLAGRQTIVDDPVRFVYIVSLIAFVSVVLGSWIPSAVAKIGSAHFLYYTWRWWWTVSLIAWPLLVGGNFVAAIFARASGVEEDEDEEEAFEDEILSMISEAENEGVLEADRADMIEGVMDLDDAAVTKVMTPRSQVDVLDVETSWDEMLEFVVESGRTRIPVFGEKIDNVVGVLFAKDLIRESMRSESKRRPLRKLVRKPLFAADSQKLDEMLSRFLEGRMHMAIVQDEYGGFAGVVTIEDVLEEIVGEIEDETDESQPKQIEIVNAQEAIVEGSTPIDMINEQMGLTLSDEDEFGTVGGLIMSHLKDIPRPGHEFTIDHVHFEIVEANRRSIRQVKVSIVDDAS
jgi:CBS domain containing-hemolysin-like protein